MTRRSVRLILASASPRRKDALEQMGFEFDIAPTDADELTASPDGPQALAEANADLKASAIADLYPDALVLGSDTVVALGDALYAKPESLDDAKRMLRELQGQTHQVISGVALIHRESAYHDVFADTTTVRLKELTDDQIEDYLKRINPLDKAGAYAIQEFGALIVDSYNGSFENVVGLPVERLEEKLNQAPYDLSKSPKP